MYHWLSFKPQIKSVIVKAEVFGSRKRCHVCSRSRLWPPVFLDSLSLACGRAPKILPHPTRVPLADFPSPHVLCCDNLVVAKWSWVHTHWCSIWKFRCPVNQSLKKDCSILQVAAIWEGKKAAVKSSEASPWNQNKLLFACGRGWSGSYCTTELSECTRLLLWGSWLQQGER